ncbi:hypothetical protein [Ferruginibacter sp.]|nr:hypothetical protein [Ferruginibacter sp.]
MSLPCAVYLYAWQAPVTPGNAQSLQPMATPVSDIVYVLTVSSDNGCGIA